MRYLVGLEHDASTPEPRYLSSVDLIQQLASIQDNARIRDASISLFLLHPELSEAILQAIQESQPPVAEQIITLVLAALYLQRKWSIRLALASGRLSTLPEAPFAQCWQERHLPAPACYYGEWGLRALQAYEQQRTGLSFMFIGDWQHQVDHLCGKKNITPIPQFPRHNWLIFSKRDKTMMNNVMRGLR